MTDLHKSDGDNGKEVLQEGRSKLPFVSLVAVGTVFWGYILGRRINRVLISRYSDIVYQIRRPDSLRNRYSAFKYFVLGGALVPTVLVTGTYFLKIKRDPDSGILLFKRVNQEAAAASKRHFSGYANNASRKLEFLADGVKRSLLEQSGPRMAEDLRKDIASVKRWIKGLF